MGKKHILIHRFYRSDTWHLARQIKIARAGGKCEMCGSVGEEVHHKIKLTPDNVMNRSISINQDNLMLLCKDCHNKVHNRFQKEKQFDSEGNFIGK